MSTSPAVAAGLWKASVATALDLAAFLDQAGERVVEVCRPKRATTRGGRKTDMLDAIRAAKEALATEHLIQPRLRGEREALRVLLATRNGAVVASTAAINQLKALIVSAPYDLRVELRTLKRPTLVDLCARLRESAARSLEHRMTVRALRSTARRIQSLQAEAKDLEKEILILVRQAAPELLELLGVGPITAAQILASWSHQGGFRSKAAFASFAGVSPIPASSGLTNRHRLNRSGDRQLNRAMHTITLIGMRLDPVTKTYVARRITEGKTSRDAQRYLKRTVCRQIFKILERAERTKIGHTGELVQAA
ncbi:transposase [Actinacidiphila glaucinigra]|uniref:transposase n=1 Tax=Actinacidiphila glaucinigra TaxID=235986 RepID=UPI003D8D33A8